VLSWVGVEGVGDVYVHVCARARIHAPARERARVSMMRACTARSMTNGHVDYGVTWRAWYMCSQGHSSRETVGASAEIDTCQNAC